MRVSRRAFLAEAAAASALTSLPLAGQTRKSAAGPAGLPAVGAEKPPAAGPPPNTRWLMPAPAQRRFPGGELAIADDFSVGLTGAADARLEAAVTRAVVRLNRRTGLALDPHRRAARGSAATLTVACQSAGRSLPSLADDESYELEITPQGARLRAAEIVGALRGLETLTQLLEPASEHGGGAGDGANGEGGAWVLPAAEIADRPRFRWRGLLLDVSRHFEPPPVVRRTLDGMAAVKLNVFHWHLSDDQGFRVECRRYPKLTELGSDGLFYTREEVRGVIAYAADRGIRVLPEFDLPAHCTSWLVGYPQLGSRPGPFQLERGYGIFENVMDPANPAVYKFLEGFFAEMAELFPDAYLHIGGDENPAHQWTNNPAIQAFMRAHGLKDNHALQTYFNRQLQPILVRHHKRMIGWEEILNPELPDTVAVEAWLGIPAVNEIAQAGHDALLAAGYYLDLMQPAGEHYQVDPLPADTPLTAAQQAHVLGGEACMWGERVDPEVLDSRLWPRLAAIAERLWSPREVNDVDDMYRRLEAASLRLEDLGMNHRAHAPEALRWLAGAGGSAQAAPPAALTTLAEALEPRKGYGWTHYQSIFAPLTYLPYAIPPESPLRRSLPAQVRRLLGQGGGASGPNGYTETWSALADLFARWRATPAELGALAAHSPQLREVLPHAATLGRLGEVGGEALDYLAARRRSPAGWREARLAELKAAEGTRADLVFIVLPPLRELIAATA